VDAKLRRASRSLLCGFLLVPAAPASLAWLKVWHWPTIIALMMLSLALCMMLVRKSIALDARRRLASEPPPW
jgi:hypothetical protein